MYVINWKADEISFWIYFIVILKVKEEEGVFAHPDLEIPSSQINSKKEFHSSCLLLIKAGLYLDKKTMIRCILMEVKGYKINNRSGGGKILDKSKLEK